MVPLPLSLSVRLPYGFKMRLPADYSEIVAASARALRAVSAEVRTAATRGSDAPELWLTVRDLEGLADRLAAMDEWQWQNGFGDMFVTGQDLGVLDELLKGGVDFRGTRIVSLTTEQAVSVTGLREFLRHYGDRCNDADHPAA
jgi:hypothetical protein